MTTVRALCGDIGPSTIGRLVVAVVVNAVERVSGRSRAHVICEGLETRNPAFADCDSTSTPLVELRVVGVQASELHAPPRMVLGRAVLSGRASVDGSGFTPLNARAVHRDGARGSKAAAALCLPAFQFSAPNQLGLAAVASAQPLPARAASNCNHGQHVELRAGRDERFH